MDWEPRPHINKQQQFPRGQSGWGILATLQVYQNNQRPVVCVCFPIFRIQSLQLSKLISQDVERLHINIVAQPLFSLLTLAEIFSTPFFWPVFGNAAFFTDEKRRNHSSLMSLYKSKTLSIKSSRTPLRLGSPWNYRDLPKI